MSPADEAVIRAALEAVGISCSLETAHGRGRPAGVTIRLAIEMRAITLSDKILGLSWIARCRSRNRRNRRSCCEHVCRRMYWGQKAPRAGEWRGRRMAYPI